MSFSDMPVIGPMLLPGANDFAARCLGLSQAAAARVQHQFDIPYGEDFFQKLDVFLPERRPPEGAPVMIFFHGGAWRNGFKEWQGFMAPPLVDLPAIFVSANYRLAPHVNVRDQLQDCCDAVAWVAHNISRLGGDPSRIFLGGHSAGGHLAALVVCSPDELARRDVDQTAIRGCFPISGIFDLRREANGDDSIGRSPAADIVPQSSNGDEFSPVTQTSRCGDAPFLIVYGSDDLERVISQSKAFEQVLRAAGKQVESYAIQGASHFEANLACADRDDRWVRTVRLLMSAPVLAPVLRD